jgi:hypothetical protein
MQKISFCKARSKKPAIAGFFTNQNRVAYLLLGCWRHS